MRKGLEKCQRDENSTPKCLPIPAPVALSILEGAEHMLPSVQWGPRDPRLQVMRSSVAFTTSYIFFNRGECSALCLAKDIVVTNDYITLRVRVEKGCKTLRAGM